MKLILTKAEKKATWAELDDGSLGKVVKAAMFQIKQEAEKQDKVSLLSAALLLCSMAFETNADKLTQTIEGLTIKGEPFGNWRVVISKTK
jgi:cyanate lyase